MDSGNSGSMQSSSGGDEEYDSRTESISAFFNSSGHVASISNPHLPQPPPPSSSSLFDPLSNYLDPFPRSPPPPNANPLLNLAMVWPRNLRSEPNCTEIGGLMGSSSSSQPVVGGQALGRGPFPGSSSMPLQPENGARPSVQSDQTNAVRNSKKRSRASRRAPTTVLTTDTSNFRAMVQEFTGIPAPPFSASPFPRSRLDLFSTAGRSTRLEPPQPPFLLRPFPQKFQPPPFLFSSPNLATSTANTVTTSTAGASTSDTSNSTSTNNYQLFSDMGLPKQSQNLLNLQNPILTFQSLLQSPAPHPPKYPLANVPEFGGKSQGSLTVTSTDSQLKMGMVLEEFDMGRGHVNTHLSGVPNFVASDGMSLRRENNPSSWGDGVGEQAHLKSFNGNYSNSQRASSCKMNYSASSSDFHVEKGPENVSARGEGMVDSWICSD